MIYILFMLVKIFFLKIKDNQKEVCPIITQLHGGYSNFNTVEDVLEF